MGAAQTYPPVAGIGFDGYVGVMVDASRAAYENAMKGVPPAPGADPYAAAAAAHGIDGATWRRLQLVWGSRCGIDPALAAEMASAISTAMGYDMPAMPMAAVPTVDPSDPGLAPIEGVPIEGYVRLIGDTMSDPGGSAEQHAAIAERHGFPPGRWEAISAAWGERVTAGHPASTRYMQLVSELID